jgi:Cu(I)/Ag(I) efflux system periplasmic protein CusF
MAGKRLIMTTLPYRSLALAGFIMLALPACASTSAVAPAADASPLMGVDLGPSSRVPRTQLAMAGAGHDGHQTAAASGRSKDVQPVHEGGGDVHATGTVNSIDTAQHTINLSHNPIPAIGWPAMTMDFAVAPSVDLGRIKPGSRVDVSMEKGKGGMYEIRSVQPAGGVR